ncbi:MAG TPA: GNAT family N-acetyltransferase, partial [Elusimicrobiota bacterium]|nr:GNAT family N-acetyltransferase [Elusimicrobiota bacterium]
MPRIFHRLLALVLAASLTAEAATPAAPPIQPHAAGAQTSPVNIFDGEALMLSVLAIRHADGLRQAATTWNHVVQQIRGLFDDRHRSIRPATLRDLGQILSLEHRSFADEITPDEFGRFAAEAPLIIKGVDSGFCLLALENGQIAGTIFAVLEDRSAMLLAGLAVAEDARRNGIGTGLMDEAMRKASRRPNVARIIARTRPNSPSRPLLRKAGFHEVSERDGVASFERPIERRRSNRMTSWLNARPDQRYPSRIGDLAADGDARSKPLLTSRFGRTGRQIDHIQQKLPAAPDDDQLRRAQSRIGNLVTQEAHDAEHFNIPAGLPLLTSRATGPVSAKRIVTPSDGFASQAASHPPAVAVERALPGDAAAIYRLREEALLPEVDINDPDAHMSEGDIRWLIGHHRDVFYSVARQGSAVVGYSVGAYDREANHGMLVEFAVRPPSEGHHIGARLAASALRWLLGHGYVQRLYWHDGGRLRGRSGHVAERFGFRRLPIVEGTSYVLARTPDGFPHIPDPNDEAAWTDHGGWHA